MDMYHTFMSLLAKAKGFGFGFNGEIVNKLWTFGFYVRSCGFVGLPTQQYGVVGTVERICGGYHW
jgi:hypothetical protein